jgi:hypothetical protein
MKFPRIFLFIISLVWSEFAASQATLTKDKFNIDTKITPEIKKFKIAGPGRLQNSMNIRVPWNDRFLFDQELDCFTRSGLAGDTINIRGYMIGELGYGFELKLFGDSCIVAPYGLSDGKIYKYNQSDTKYADFIRLSCRSYKVVLPAKPFYRAGEIIEGYVEMESNPFYYAGLDGKFNIQIRAYFKTDSIKRTH